LSVVISRFPNTGLNNWKKTLK